VRAALPAPLLRTALSGFGRLPAWVRRRAVHAGAPSFTVGAVVVLTDVRGWVLLVRQRHSAGWTLPGGLLRRGETPEHALTREVGEEIAVELPAALPPPFAVVDAGARRVDLVYTLRSDQQPRPDGVEVTDAQWFAPTAWPQCARATAEVLHRVHRADADGPPDASNSTITRRGPVAR